MFSQLSEWFTHWISTVPPGVVYAAVGLVVLVESLGVPFPGEFAVISATLITVQPGSPVHWPVLAVCAGAGAVVGDSIGYAIGHRGGRPLFGKLGRRFPRHFGPKQFAAAERAFARWGAWAVFLGRFVLLLRIFAGPLAGALKMRYRDFFAANALGGVVWAAGTTALIHYAGTAVEKWLSGFALWSLVAAAAFGIATSLLLRHRAAAQNKDV